MILSRRSYVVAAGDRIYVGNGKEAIQVVDGEGRELGQIPLGGPLRPVDEDILEAEKARFVNRMVPDLRARYAEVVEAMP